MIYVTSDWHGTEPEGLQHLLEVAGFSEADDLFVLGDVADRGNHGAELLLWLSQQPNVHLIRGNHEEMLLACRHLFTDSEPPESRAALERHWQENGGEPTVAGLKALYEKDPELVWGILDLVADAPYFDTVEAGGHEFVLVHGGLGNFAKEKPLEDYDPYELVWTRPDLNTRYYDDKTVIFGHTPTVFFGYEYVGRAVETDTWICIDTGCAAGLPPMLLRLDDMTAFYG